MENFDENGQGALDLKSSISMEDKTNTKKYYKHKKASRFCKSSISMERFF